MSIFIHTAQKNIAKIADFYFKKLQEKQADISLKIVMRQLHFLLPSSIIFCESYSSTNKHANDLTVPEWSISGNNSASLGRNWDPFF